MVMHQVKSFCGPMYTPRCSPSSFDVDSYQLVVGLLLQRDDGDDDDYNTTYHTQPLLLHFNYIATSAAAAFRDESNST
jgi:hypothetical protein